jgi:hypothetical protein
MLTFTDDYTRRSWIYLTRARTELYERFREWQMTAERQSNEKLQAIRCDNVGEYQALATRLRQENRVVVEFTTPHTLGKMGWRSGQWRYGLGKGQVSVISEFSVAWHTHSSPGSNEITSSTRRRFGGYS